MNRENILKVADYIENAPKEQFHMGAWFGNYIEDDYIEEFDPETENYPLDKYWEDSSQCEMIDVEDLVAGAIGKELSCGTTACIAGWAATTFYYEDRQKYDEYLKDNDGYYAFRSVESFAKEYLGLDDIQAQRLFFCNADSIWNKVKEEYGMEFLPSINESWDINNKQAADVLRRIADGELKLNGWVSTNEEN